ncbi:hypothetical protein HDK90DRAFT_479017 [Phyllosticta capitalensis]|uniref:Secreted protein n=1 Tax=Phyllosticta capitalensis TaxID=121624 RepID=A0ABR1YVF6_9PEZI
MAALTESLCNAKVASSTLVVTILFANLCFLLPTSKELGRKPFCLLQLASLTGWKATLQWSKFCFVRRGDVRVPRTRRERGPGDGCERAHSKRRQV